MAYCVGTAFHFLDGVHTVGSATQHADHTVWKLWSSLSQESPPPPPDLTRKWLDPLIHKNPEACTSQLEHELLLPCLISLTYKVRLIEFG